MNRTPDAPGSARIASAIACFWAAVTSGRRNATTSTGGGAETTGGSGLGGAATGDAQAPRTAAVASISNGRTLRMPTNLPRRPRRALPATPRTGATVRTTVDSGSSKESS
ncbi:hypothetical protein GCM10027575_77740 [Phytohabitans suffuscus]